MLKNLSPAVKHILLATIFFGVVNALVKFYSHIPSVQIVFFRSVITLILSYIVLSRNKISIRNKHYPLLLARGLCGGLGLLLYFSTLQRMPLASAVTILYLAPVFTLIMASFFLKEAPNKWQWPFILLGLLGAAIMKEFDPRINNLDLLMGLGAALFSGMAYNFIRMLKDRAHHQLIIFYFPLVTIPLTIPFLYNNWSALSANDLFGLLLIGISTQLAQINMTKAYMLERASKITHYNYLTTIYAAITGVIFFGEMIHFSTMIGIALIVFGVAMSAYFGRKN